MLDFTTASATERKRAYDAIAKELGDDQFFTSKELDTLPKILSPMEQVLSFSSGIMDGNTWLIVLTDSRVLFVDKGMIFGLKQTSIDLENIVSIEGETGFIMGTIRVSTAAGPREIRNVWKRTVTPFLNKVRAAQSAKRRGERLQAPGTDATDVAAPDPDHSAPPSQPVPAPAPSPTPTAEQRTPEPPPIMDMRAAASPSSQPVPERTDTPQLDKTAAMARLERLRSAGAIDEAGYQAQASALR